MTSLVPAPHAAAVLAITVATFYLYTRPGIRMELVSLLMLASLLLVFHVFPMARPGGELTELEVLQSFGHPALIAICALMILGQGLTATGALEPAVRILARVWTWNRWAGLLAVLLVAMVASGFVNDTPVLVLMLPMLLGIAQRTGQSPAPILMPVNFAILAGGMLTSIGTSTNLLVLSIASQLGMTPMGIFDFTGLTIVACLAALPYLWLVAPRLLPDRGGEVAAAERQFEARLVVTDSDCKLVGRTLTDLGRTLGRPLLALSLLRGGLSHVPSTDDPLVAGDALVVRDTARGLRELATAFHVDLFDPAGEGRFVESDTTRVEVDLAEVVIGTDSRLVGRTLGQARFAEAHGLVVVGLSRGTEGFLRSGRSIGNTRLAAGDVLLVQGPADRLAALRSVDHLLLLDGRLGWPRSPLAPWALGIMAAVIVAAATKFVPIHVAAFLGAIAMLVKGCIKLDGIGRALSLEVILLVAASLALGQSLVQTGAAGWIAGGAAAALHGVPAALQLVAFMVLGALLTNFVSNSAAAAVGTPIAFATAVQLASPVEPYVLSILFGANLSFATPMAYQTNLLVMKAANYTFGDFVRIGVPLVLLMLAVLATLLVQRYGL